MVSFEEMVSVFQADQAKSLEAALANDPELQLLIPQNDVLNPEISIVIPAMNERITISTFVEWCQEGLAAARIAGEILIVDSSKDETPHLALAGGAQFPWVLESRSWIFDTTIQLL